VFKWLVAMWTRQVPACHAELQSAPQTRIWGGGLKGDTTNPVSFSGLQEMRSREFASCQGSACLRKEICVNSFRSAGVEPVLLRYIIFWLTRFSGTLIRKSSINFCPVSYVGTNRRDFVRQRILVQNGRTRG